MVPFNLQATWQSVLDEVEKHVSKPSFETWLKSTVLIELDEHSAIVGVPNSFAQDWLEKNYVTLVADSLMKVTKKDRIVRFVVPQAAKNDSSLAVQQTADLTPQVTEETYLPSTNVMLNPKYTFETFVVGSGNRFAHAASLAVAEVPANAYNPLFIYGGVGLGKTHLMHAIGHYVLEQDPTKKVVYVSSEKFMNEFINSIQENKAEEFRNQYRTVDVLLIDDIQFLEKKERTQEEFFHTFNALHEDSKQIIISSDRPPREISTLEDRLRSRFEWGLITDIAPPDLETRTAILKKKAEADGMDIPNEVMLFIADRVDSNIRELEGALTRVVAYADLTKEDISIDLANEALQDIIANNQPKPVSILDIQEKVGEHYNITLEDFISPNRTRTVAFPRQVAMYLSRELTTQSLPKIGDEFGGRDHSTVIHAHDKITRLLQEDEQLQEEIQQICTTLGR